MNLDLPALAALGKLEKSSRPGPWEYANEEHIRDYYADTVLCLCGDKKGATGELIVALRNAAPSLIALAREAFAAREMLKAFDVVEAIPECDRRYIAAYAQHHELADAYRALVAANGAKHDGV